MRCHQLLCPYICQLFKVRRQKNIFPSSFSKGPKADSDWTEWVRWPFLTNQCGQRSEICKLTRPGAHAKEQGDWVLGRGKIAEVEVVVHEGVVASLGARLGDKDF